MTTEAQTMQLRVGDKIRGYLSGHVGTVTAVHDDGTISAVEDAPGRGWQGPLPRGRFEFISRPSAKPKFSPGDTVRGRTGCALKVLAVHEESGLFWGVSASGKPLTYHADDCGFEKVEPFFEVGKAYAYGRLTFLVDQVRTDDNGAKVAIGKDENGAWRMRRTLGAWTEKR